jgi:hypothetical protein
MDGANSPDSRFHSQSDLSKSNLEENKVISSAGQWYPSHGTCFHPQVPQHKTEEREKHMQLSVDRAN